MDAPRHIDPLRNQFWQCLKALAALFDGKPEAVDETLDSYEDLIANLPKQECEQAKCDIDAVVGSLARLSMSLKDS